MNLENRVAVITGATGSLGPTVCRTFATAGARIVPVGTRQEKLDRLVADLALPEEQIHAVVANLLEPESVASMVQSVRERSGRLDIWLHMVGGYRAGAAVPDFDLADLSSMLQQHLHTTLNTARTVVPVMKEAGWGRIVAVTDPAEIAAAMLWLCSDEAAATNGARIPIYGRV